MLVRHGVMLVGPTGGGKTTVYTILADTLNALHLKELQAVNPFYQPVRTYVLNPKSVSMGELYGEVRWTESHSGSICFSLFAVIYLLRQSLRSTL